MKGKPEGDTDCFSNVVESIRPRGSRTCVTGQNEPLAFPDLLNTHLTCLLSHGHSHSGTTGPAFSWGRREPAGKGSSLMRQDIQEVFKGGLLTIVNGASSSPFPPSGWLSCTVVLVLTILF